MVSSPLCRRHATATLWTLGSFHDISSVQKRFFSADNLDSSTVEVSADVSSSLINKSSQERLTKAKQSLDQLHRSNRLEAPEEAERILRDIEDFSPRKMLHAKYYHQVLDLYIARNRVDRAHDLLLTMKQTPSKVGFAIVSRAWIRRGQLPKVENLLTFYLERGIAGTVCFNILISEYAHRRNYYPRKAVKLLRTMDAYARSGHPEAKPDKVTMTSMMQILARRGQALEAEALLQRMFDSKDPDMAPDAVTYSLVFKAYANNSTHDAAEQAQQLLEKMEERFKLQKEFAIKPNTVIYNTFLSVVANAGDGERAEAVLKHMEAHEDLKPDTISYGTVLTAWKNAGNGERAEQLLWRVPHPDHLSFSITIAALAKQGQGKRAEALLYYMYQDGRDELRPNIKTHTAVLNAWANSKDPDAFENAKRVFHETGKMQNTPIDTAVFNSFLKAVENSSEPDKVDMVVSTLQRMKTTKYSSPNSSTYRQAILAIAATNGDSQVKQDALHAALQIYQDRTSLPAKEQKDVKLHTAMLEACGKLSPKGVNGDEIVEQVFQSCCKEGVVSSLFTMLLKEAASDELLKRIFSTDTLDREVFYSFPQSWSRTRNSRPRKGRR
jgi:pentatricopeptide repeat protein